MEGDLSEISTGAGIIPRTLHSLFEHLEKGDIEYSVRVSFMELYNEELRDLLASDQNQKKLKMFEDLNQKGSVVIQGLDEVLVKSAQDVISVLQQGSVKRQQAATKMNESSSRSHGIFSITVHIKESTSNGEELLKVGKLHLVDLAGSENIGRSGAENRRAKEAGMINQSLLTLGRVINALVERSPHIPYRESKLTRLLQDSLGGRTKTCIIAAVSPARNSLEETLSTLDYAHRAKNIRNKPEVNQKLTKRALIRDYATQIERLKADLVASREKNGIFLSRESYESLVEENQGGKSTIDELSKLMEAKQEEIKQIEEKFMQQIKMFSKTKEELEEARSEIEKNHKDMEMLMDELRFMRMRLLEQEYLTNAHKETEKSLHNLASGLSQTLMASAQDLDFMHSKVERKTKIERENLDVFEQFQEDLFEKLEAMGRGVLDVRDLVSGVCGIIEDTVGHSARNGSEKKMEWESHLSMLDERLRLLQGSISENVSTSNAQLEKVIVDIRNVVKGLSGSMKAIQCNKLNQLLEHIGLIQASVTSQQEYTKAQSELISRHFEHTVTFTSAFFHNRIKELEDQYHQRVSKMQLQMEALRSANKDLMEQGQRHRQDILENKHRFLELFTGQLDTFVTQMQDQMVQFQTSTTNVLDMQVDEVNSQFQEEKEIHKMNVEGVTNCAHSLEQSRQEQVEVAEEMQNVSEQKERYIAHEFERVVHQVDRTSQQLEEDVNNLEENIEQRIGAVGAQVFEWNQKLDSTIQDFGVQGLEHTSHFAASIQSYHSITSQNLESIHKKIIELETLKQERMDQFASLIEQCHDTLQGNVLQKDLPTGKTPRRKAIIVPEWELTKSHDELLQEFRNKEKENVKKSDMEREVPVTPVSKLPMRRKGVLGDHN